MGDGGGVIEWGMGGDGGRIRDKKLVDSLGENLGIRVGRGGMGMGEEGVRGMYKRNGEVIGRGE